MLVAWTGGVPHTSCDLMMALGREDSFGVNSVAITLSQAYRESVSGVCPAPWMGPYFKQAESGNVLGSNTGWAACKVPFI